MANQKERELRIFGSGADSLSGVNGINWHWKSGPVEVTITPSWDGSRNAWDSRVHVHVFGEHVASEWRRTDALAAKWAERKLKQIQLALVAK